MVQKRGALSEVTSLQKDITKLFEQLGQLDHTEAGIGLGEWFPRIDVFDTKKNVVVKVEAPGFETEDLEVVFRGPKMILSGEKKQSKNRFRSPVRAPLRFFSTKVFADILHSPFLLSLSVFLSIFYFQKS